MRVTTDGFFILEILIALTLICMLVGIVGGYHAYVVAEYHDQRMQCQAVNAAADFFEVVDLNSMPISGEKSMKNSMQLCWHIKPFSGQIAASDYGGQPCELVEMHLRVTWSTYSGKRASVSYIMACAKSMEGLL